MLVLLCTFSCVKTTENHASYLAEGEIRYTTKPFEVRPFVGKGRVQLRAFVRNAYSVSEFIVQWNEGETVNSKAYPFVKGEAEVDSINLIVDGLAEKAYFFDVYTQDNNSNQSVKVTTFASSFGESYRSNLTPRRISSIVHNGTDGVISWFQADNLERGSQVRFTNTDNEEVEVQVDQNASEVTLEKLSIDSKIQFRSFYVPLPPNDLQQESSIDTFESEWSEASIPPELTDIVETIELEPIIEGVNLSWSNDIGLPITVGIEYTVGGETKSQKFSSAGEPIGSEDVVGLANGTQDVSVSVAVASGSSVAKKISVTPIAITQFSPDELKIVALETDHAGLGSFPATNLIDGATNTFYHTSNGSYDDFPHHVTIDLGQEYSLAKFSLYPRHDCCQDRNPTKFQLWGISDTTGAETKLPSKDAGWEDEAKSLGWTLLIEVEPGDDWNGSTNPITELIPADDKTYRYIRLRSLSNFSQHPQTAYGELQLWRFGE